LAIILFTKTRIQLKAEIITIGDEILIGQVVDTNSAWLATELNKLGVEVVQITSVSDNRNAIIEGIDRAIERAGLVITTGGLGPTSDDITKTTLAEYFDTQLILNQQVAGTISTMLALRGVVMNERNLKQAELPEACEILPNSAGTAQGMWFSKNGSHLVSLPGVPFEMKTIFSDELKPRILDRFHLPFIRHITLLTHGGAESEIAIQIREWEEDLPKTIRLAYLPSPGLLRLRLSGRTEGNVQELEQLMEKEKQKLETLLRDYVFGYNDDKLEEIVGRLLAEKGQTLSLAESCTGGYIASLIASVPGCSAYFNGGVIAYSNESKSRELDVSPYTLMINGSVSQPVAEQMAHGCRMRFQTDFALAVTGIAGPSGGTEEKPVGTTWIAVADKHMTYSKSFRFGDNRGRNIQKSAMAALFMLRKTIMNCQ